MPPKAQKPYSSVRGKPIGSDTAKARNDYLVAYNGISAIMWSAVLSQVIGTVVLYGWEKVFDRASEFTQLVQSLAALEVLHSAAGMLPVRLSLCMLRLSAMQDLCDHHSPQQRCRYYHDFFWSGLLRNSSRKALLRVRLSRVC